MSERPYVAVVGGINLDIQARCFRVFRAGDSNPGTLTLTPGGVGRNIAENLVRLGARVELVTVLGDDGHSAMLEASCASIGIGLGGALRARGSASHYLCILDADGSLAGAVAAMDSIDRLTPDWLEAISGVLDTADLIMIDANVPEASIAWLSARYPKGSGGPILGFDPVSVAKAPRGAAALGSFGFAKPNLAEAAVLAGVEPSALGPAALACRLRARGLDEAFISLGADGLFAEGPDGDAAGKGGAARERSRRERWRARLPSDESRPKLINSSGAGDAASAAIAWGLLSGFGLGDRCALGLAAATIAAASEATVNPRMSAELLTETAKGIERERLP